MLLGVFIHFNQGECHAEFRPGESRRVDHPVARRALREGEDVCRAIHLRGFRGG